MVFVVVVGAVLVVFGALALRLDLKDRRFARGRGLRPVSRSEVRAEQQHARAEAAKHLPNANLTGGGFGI